MKIALRIFLSLLSLGVLMGVGLLGLIIYISFDLPKINSLSDYNPPIPSQIFSKDGEVLLEIGKETRDIAEFSEIPTQIVNAFLAAEDDNFYNHSGIDYKGILRATLKNIKAGRVVQGASTITQQVAKSLLLSSERTFSRKIKDLILAHRIEQQFSKNEILFLYLNQVYLGGGYYGIKAAFKGYFRKSLEEATIAEISLVAGLLVAPGKYSPYVNPHFAKKRQRYVLGRLLKTGKITEEEYRIAVEEKVKLHKRRSKPVKAGYFTDWIRQRLIGHFGKEDFISNGYKVYTTIDWELQKKAEDAVWEGVKNIDKRQGYKGPLENLAKEQWTEFIKKQRNEVYEEASRYFLLTADGKKEKEFEGKDPEEAEEVEEERSGLIAGIDPTDDILDFVKPSSKPIKALVEKVSSNQKLIYVNHAGIKFLIGYDDFKWAHERKVTEERHYWGYVKNPKSIVKEGDVVEISFSSKNFTNIWTESSVDFRKSVGKNRKLIRELQAEKFIKAKLDQWPDAQAALVSVSPFTGELVSMVGGSDFSVSQFNRAIQSNRQPGSAFKPVIFAVGLENGLTPSSILYDTPQALGSMDSQLNWKPRNYDGKFKGTMTFRRALETSRNIPTILLTQQVGVDKIKNYVERLGLNIDLPQDLSVSLGSFGINLLDLVKLYTVYPNGGKKLRVKTIEKIIDRFGKPHFLEDEIRSDNEVEIVEEPVEEQTPVVISATDETENSEGEEVEEKPENPFLVNLNENQVYDSRLAYIMSNLMKGVVQNGTGAGARNVSSFIGGKTGTTNNYVDAWFLGFSSNIVTGVWTGFDDNNTLGWGETGAKAALPIWKEYMQAALRKLGEADFNVPPGIVNVSVNRESGELYVGRGAFTEAFVEGTEPGVVQEKPKGEEEGEDNFLNNDDYYSEQ